MTGTFCLQPPLVIGDRTIIPVVSRSFLENDHGMIGVIQPVALLIGEGEKWGFVLLEGDSVVALLEKIVLPGGGALDVTS
jgi:hypothetical protein